MMSIKAELIINVDFHEYCEEHLDEFIEDQRIVLCKVLKKFIKLKFNIFT